jgi:hypothetical protein
MFKTLLMAICGAASGSAGRDERPRRSFDRWRSQLSKASGRRRSPSPMTKPRQKTRGGTRASIDLEERAIAARDQPELRWEAVGRADQSIKSWRTDDDGQEEPMRVSGALLFAVLASTVPALAAERLELPTREAGLWEISSETIGRPRRTFGLPNEERGSAGVIIIVAASIASESDD